MRTFAETSSSGNDKTIVARISASEGARTSSHRPGTMRLTIIRIAASFSALLQISVAVPKITTER